MVVHEFVPAVTAAAIPAVLLVVGVYLYVKRDPYKHLNEKQKSDVRGADAASKVLWMNMGWWTDESTRFHDACEMLARQLYVAAGLTKGVAARILDVGHGSGDSLLLLAREYQPEHLVGVTASKSEADVARLRCNAAIDKNDTRVQVHANDASRFLHSKESGEYDYIFALDCAHHFPSRLGFFREAHRRLDFQHGGTLALFDLCSSWPPAATSSKWYKPDSNLPQRTAPPTLWQRCRLVFSQRMSSSTLVDVHTYHSLLVSSGFDADAIEIRDISSRVFPGFARFLTTYGDGDGEMPLGQSAAVKFALRSFGRIVRNWAQGGDNADVRGVIVVARRTQAS